MNLFGEEEFKPVVRFEKVIPGYYVNKKGEIYSAKTGKLMKLWNTSKGNYLAVTFHIPNNLFSDYDHRRASKGKNCKTCKINCEIHRIVLETWKPIDKYPPQPLENCWNDIPEPAKQIIRECAVVDHINPDSKNPYYNHLNNLRWVTPKQNSSHRKKNEFLQNH